MMQTISARRKLVVEQEHAEVMRILQAARVVGHAIIARRAAQRISTLHGGVIRFEVIDCMQHLQDMLALSLHGSLGCALSHAPPGQLHRDVPQRDLYTPGVHPPSLSAAF